MRLLQLRLCNFRQFYGESPSINLEPMSSARNVVLFHGINGSGKTAILNAFTWVLYGDFPRKSEGRIVNKRATREGDGKLVKAWVEVSFRHGHHTYEIRRTVVARFDRMSGEWDEDRGGEVTIMSNDMTDSQGWRREDGALVGEIVGRILPEDLYGYFFFDGERIERIVQKRKEERDQLGKATRTLLGVEVLTRAEFHLAKVRKQFEGQLRKMGDPETKGLLDDKASLEEDLHRYRAESDEKANSIEVFEKHIGDIEGELLRIASTAAMQERRNELSRDKKNVDEALLRCDDRLASLVSRSGYSVFMGDAVGAFRAVSADLAERGQLPSGIKLQFVEDLLEGRVCICGEIVG